MTGKLSQVQTSTQKIRTVSNKKGLYPVIFFFDEKRPLSGDFDSLRIGEYESSKKNGGLYGFFT